MPAQIDYSQRDWYENVFDPGAWQNLLSGASGLVTSTATAWEQIEKTFGSQPLDPGFTPRSEPTPPPSPSQSYDPNFVLTPNQKLIAIGVGILLLFLVIKK